MTELATRSALRTSGEDSEERLTEFPGPTFTGKKKIYPLKRLNHVHRAMAAVMVANPAIKPVELASLFQVSPGWAAAVIGSEPFQKYLEGKTDRVIDPLLRGALGETFKGLLLQASEKVREKMSANPSDGFVLAVFQNASKALGYGNQSSVNVTGAVSHHHSLVSVISSLPPPERPARVIESAQPIPAITAQEPVTVPPI